MTTTLVEYRPPLAVGLPTKGVFVLAGPPKTAKTTFAASFPDAYVLECEPGGGDRIAGRIHDISNLAEFREAFKAAIEAPDVKTIVVDTLDFVADWIDREIAQEAQLDSIRDTKKGVNGFELWKEFMARIQGLIGYAKESGKLVIFIAHYKPPKTNQDGAVVNAASIELTGQKAANYVLGQADIIGFASRRVGAGSRSEFYIDFQGGPLATIGSRVRELNDKRIGPIPEDNPYAAFSAVFDAPEPAKANGNGAHAETESAPAKAEARNGNGKKAYANGKPAAANKRK